MAWFGCRSEHRILFTALSNAACLKRRRGRMTPITAFLRWVRTDIKGALSLNFCWPMRPKFRKGSALPDRREVTMTMREYEERFRSPPPSLHQIFVGIRGPNHSRQRIRYLWAVAALVGGLIAGAVSGDFRLFR